MKSPLSLLFVFCLNLILANAQLNEEKLNQYFNVLEENEKLNGTVAISQNGKIIFERSLGFADFESQQKNNSETKFRIGSITKTFTSVLILKAADEGKLDLDKTIDYFFPNLKNGKKITTKLLLHHRSGIFSLTSDPNYMSWYTKPKSKTELLEIISSYESNFEPGTQFEYSNSNYILLTFILEKIYEKSYAEILTEKIIQPLALKNTRFGGEIKSLHNEANSYKYNFGNWVKQSETDMSIPLGAGAIVSNPEDIIKFGEAMFGGKIISASNLTKMMEMKDGYGLGIFELPVNEKKAYGHNGGIDGFLSGWAYIPDDKVSIAITLNGSTIDPTSLALTLFNAFYSLPYEIPNYTKVEVKPEELKALTGVYTNAQLGMEITITENNGVLYGQATGQSAFPLDAYGKNEFRFEMAGIVLVFAENHNSFILKQGGGEFVFEKK